MDIEKKESDGKTKGKSFLKYNNEWYYKPFGTIPNISLGQMLKQSTKRYKSRIALIEENRSLTFEELDDYSDRFASFLLEIGIKKGDRVATQLPNSIDHVIVYFGIVKVGAISVPFNIMYKKGEVVHILNNSGAIALVVSKNLYDNYDRILEDVQVKTVICCDLNNCKVIGRNKKIQAKSSCKVYDLQKILMKDIKNIPITIEINPKDDLQLILYTAGTTGQPKGVMLTHFNFIFNLENRACTDNFGVGTTALTLFPMFHVSGYMLYLLFTIYIGGKTILAQRFEAEKYLRILGDCKVNLFTAPPAVFIGMLNSFDIGKADLSNLKYCTAAGAPVPSSLQHKWQKKTGLKLLTGFGMTETSATAIVNLNNKSNLEPGCIGLPLGGEVAIVNDSGEVVEREEVGEILFRGPQVMKGYWQDPVSTKKALTKEGWLKTGDIGYMNYEGFIFFVDRKKEMIIASGYNISPAEIENLLLGHPAIQEAAVIGIPHEYRGETVKAFVVLKKEFVSKINEQELIVWGKDNMAAYKYPRFYEFLEELPKSESQKVLRRVLRDREAVKYRK